MSNSPYIALCLSGGGIRAMAFHAGLLMSLAEANKLEKVKYISTVSGGSLLVGLIYSLNNHQWPSSLSYIHTIYPQIESALTNNKMAKNALCRLCFNPMNWKFLFSRSNVIAQALESQWGINGTVGNIKKLPEWSINGTTSESGKRFRVKNGEAGDYMLGYFDANILPLSAAIAMSAAVPGILGPLVINSKSFDWYKKDYVTREKVTMIPTFDYLHVYDGGVYDNLGTEQFFDIGKQKLKHAYSDCTLIVSDAGSPFELSGSTGKLNPLRLLRINDIMMSQSRSLRVRSLMNYFTTKCKKGAYIKLGEPLELLSKYYKFNSSKKSKYSKSEIQAMANYSTTLLDMPKKSYQSLSTHCSELTNALIINNRI